jgi:hypothetical protein
MKRAFLLSLLGGGYISTVKDDDANGSLAKVLAAT